MTRDILLRSYNYCRNRPDGCCYYLMEERDESGTIYKCAYYGNHRCKKGMLDDAIELLKEQEAIPVVQREIMHMLVWCCGSCGVAITDGDKFCRMCGRKVKWDG